MEIVLSHVNTPRGTSTLEEASMLWPVDIGLMSVLVAHEQGVHGGRDESYAWAHNYGLLLPRLM